MNTRRERLLTEELIKSDCVDIQLEETRTSVCPFCKAKHEMSFGVTRIEEGLLYNCFRAACGARGFISSLVGTIPPERRKIIKKFNPRSFNKDLYKVPPDVLEFLNKSYELTEDTINEQGIKYDPKSNRIYMPVFDRFSNEYGGVTKALGRGGSGPKTLNYFTRETSRIHYPRKERRSGQKVAVVEDILSGIKVSRYVDCVALLGHTINIDQITELRNQYTDIILMLDADVIHKALKYKELYSLYFRNFQVVLLSKDPKDTTNTELEEILKCYIE